MEMQISQAWHTVPAEQVIARLEVDPKSGLSIEEAERRLRHYGRNEIQPKPPKPLIVRFLLQFHQPLIYIMNASGITALFLKEWVDATVIFGVVMLNAIIGLVQESKATSALASLAKTVLTHAMVVRGGRRMKIPSGDLVPGDWVEFYSGDRVPADIRVVEVKNLTVDESRLTGESVPVTKRCESLHESVPLAERNNMLYSSTLVSSGHGYGLVVATGEQTEIGKISQLIRTAQDLETPLTRKIDAFSGFLLYVILGLAAISSVIGILRGQTWMDMLMAAVAIAVGAIPEGLPAAVTITLAIGVYRMAKQRAIVRKLPAVEGLGSVTVICSDKTGTLTDNQMTTRQIFSAGHLYEVTGSGFSPEGEILHNGGRRIDSRTDVSLAETLKAGLLCNVSLLVEVDGRWQVEGDPTEGALLAVARKAGLNGENLHKEFPRLDAIPFESETQFMATLHEAPAKRVIYVKGSVEAILARCVQQLDDQGKVEPIRRDEVHAQFLRMAREGLRVLGFAKTEESSEKNDLSSEDVQTGLTFLGLQGMMDPPRGEATEAIRKCKAAGIAVKMVTGDHALTALVIGEEMGLIAPTREDERNLTHGVVSGKEMENLGEEELAHLAQRSSIFARVTPEQKFRLVKGLQSQGHLVAMTGDGVNDAPALKQADIGIAMGVKGTEVAKEAADMVLLDDNFATLEAAVEEGRGVFDNITKFIIWTLPTNLGQGLVIMAAILANFELPILPVQILWLNMTTAVFLGLMLAFEPKEQGIMSRPPRDPKKKMLTPEIMGRIISVGIFLLLAAFGLFVWEKRLGSSIEEARTVAVNVFVMVMTFYLFNCRSLTKSMFQIGVFSNAWVLAGVAVTWALQILYTYTPFMNRLFQSAPIDPIDWLWIFVAAFIVYAFVGTEKWLRRRLAAA